MNFGFLGSSFGGMGWGGATTFDPASIFAAGVLGSYHDASYLGDLYQTNDTSSPVTATDQTVGYWRDRSGNGNHATQATGTARPLYRDIGGLKYIDFVSSDRLVGVANPKWLHDGTGGYLAVVCQCGVVAEPDVLYYICGTRGSAIANGFTLGFDDRSASGHNQKILVATATKYSARGSDLSLPSNSIHLVEVIVQTGANGVKGYVDGVLAVQTTLASPDTSDCSFGLDIGAGGNGDIPLRGYVSAVLTANTVPSADYRAQLLAFLT